MLINIIPTNPVQALASSEMLQIIFFAILLGISILMVGKKAKHLMQGVEIGNEVMMKMVHIIMSIAPYAVFCLIAQSMAELGLDLLGHLAGYVVVLVAALMLHLFVTLMVILKVFSGLNPVIFLKKMRSVQVFGFSTASSNATIPVTLRTVTERLGVDNSVASFTVPFGATINMDGTALYEAVAAVFIANLYNVDLSFIQQVTVFLTAVLASVGAAGIPSAGLVTMALVLQSVGLPLEGIGLILAVDRFLDMLRTSVNVWGDLVGTRIIWQRSS